MKKLALISTFCDKQIKVDLLHNTILKIKEKGLDVLIYTPINLPSYIYELCDYVIKSKENPVLNWPEKAYWRWIYYITNGKKIQMNITTSDHGYACLNQFKKMGIYGLSMNYDIYYPIIYDLDVNDLIYELIDKNFQNSFFPSRRGTDLWVIGLHFASLDSSHLENFVKLIDKKSYLQNLNYDAFDWLHEKVEILDCVIQPEFVDELYTIDNEVNYYNQSLFEDIVFFIQKKENDKIKILFYNFEGYRQITIETENFVKELKVKNFDVVEFEESNFEKFNITMNNQTIDHTEILKKIINNSLDITES